VQWWISALGKEFHIFHLHSNQGFQGWVNSHILGPSTTLTVEYAEDNPGDWLYHCHVTDQMVGGMVGRYHVPPDPAWRRGPGTCRPVRDAALTLGAPCTMNVRRRSGIHCSTEENINGFR
jgi:hypothetical protein